MKSADLDPWLVFHGQFQVRAIPLRHRPAKEVLEKLEVLVDRPDPSAYWELSVRGDSKANVLIVECHGRIPEWVDAGIEQFDRDPVRVTRVVAVHNLEAAEIVRRCHLSWCARYPAYLALQDRSACVLPDAANANHIFSEVEKLPDLDVDARTNAVVLTGLDEAQLAGTIEWIQSMDAEAKDP